MSESYDKYQQISSDEERKQAICEGDVESFQRLTDCLRTSNSHNGLSFLLYSKQPKFIKTISDTIENHNQTCPDSVLTSPIY